MLDNLDTTTPVLLLGGMENATCTARSLGRAGVTVRVSGGRTCSAMRSRYCAEAFPIPGPGGLEDGWRELLLGQDRRLDGHVLLPMMDEAIAFVIEHREALATRYILEDFEPALRSDLLDKRRTIEIAQSLGLPAPKFWPIEHDTNVAALRQEVRFPAMVKPLHTFKFAKVFGRKLHIVETDFDELAEHVERARNANLGVIIVEMIPGPDSLLSSYYTYITGNGQRLFDYTKRIIRRFPTHRGGGCHHESVWLPETAAAGQTLLDKIGWRGMANIEFKRDPRDGQLKLIEVNSRFTAAHRLVLRAGMPIDIAVYRHLTSQPVPRVHQGAHILRQINPFRDFRAFRSLARSENLRWSDWIRSLTARPFVTPVFSLRDPAPSLVDFGIFLSRAARKLSK